jgi:hypothetical protein
VTGSYNFDTYTKFNNYPGCEYTVAAAPAAEWTQACLIQVDKVQFVKFARSVYVSETETSSATATLFANATSTGDCGSTYSTVCSLTGEDGSVVDVPISSADVLSLAGGSITVNVARDEQAYTFTCSVTATEAPQDADVHTATMVDGGFVNILSATSTAVGTSLAPLCNVEV